MKPFSRGEGWMLKAKGRGQDCQVLTHWFTYLWKEV